MSEEIATHPNTTPAERERMLLDYKRDVREPKIVWRHNAHLAIMALIHDGLLAYRGKGVIQLTEAGVTKHLAHRGVGDQDEGGD